MTVRKPTAAEAQHLALLRGQLLTEHPYYSAALYDMIPLAAPGLGTFAVDKHWRFYYDPQVLEPWGIEGGAAALEHEMHHLLRDHGSRFATASRHDIANIATDCEINDDLADVGTSLPVAALYPEQFDLDPHGVAERYYHDLCDKFPPPPPEPSTGTGETGDGTGQSGSGTNTNGNTTPCDATGDDCQSNSDGGEAFSGCGSGAGGAAGSHELPADSNTAPARSAERATVTRRTVAAAVISHAKTTGSTPGGIQRWANEELKPAQVPWQQVLAGAIRRNISRYVAGKTDFTWKRPSRRQAGHAVLPGVRRPTPNIAIVIDTSGSMSNNDLTTCLSETQAVLTRCDLSSDTVRIYTVDATATDPQEVTDAHRIILTGNGGTDMRVGYRAAVDNQRHRPGLVIILTDGFTPWPAPAELTVPLIAAVITTPGTTAPDIPDHIRSVRIETAPIP